MEFHIKGNFEVPALLEMYDVMGRKVKEVSVNRQRLTVNVSTLPSGIYVWRIGTARGKVVVE